MTRWFANYVGVSRWFANELPDEARLHCRLSSSLHASHDKSVSVTPFNPITPTWSDTNSITSFLLLHLFASPLLISWYSSCHQSGFYSLMSWKTVASGIALPPFLSFIETVFHLSLLYSGFWLCWENSEPLIIKELPQTSFFIAQIIKKTVPLSLHWIAAKV